MKNKPLLIIISDLWGKEQSAWLASYTERLKSYFTIIYYDCCELGEVDKSTYIEQNLHHQFVNGGSEKAIANLCAQQKGRVNILAFSVGGYIGWKASLSTLNTAHIFAVSSTRLRYAVKKPPCNIELFYGEHDEYKPEDSWFENLQIEKQVIPNQNHNFYQKPEFAEWLTNRIIEKLFDVNHPTQNI